VDLPAHLLDNPADESFWDTHKVHTELSAHGGSTSLRSTERLLEKVLWMPSVRSLLDLRDELDRPLVRLVVDAVEAQAKKKRISMLLLQVARVASDKYVVFVNDGRGGRRWRFVEQLNVQTIADALARLSAGKSVYIWPHGQATGWLRRIEAARKSAQMVQSDGTILTLVLTPYRATLELAPYPKSPERQNNDLTHLDALEAESIHIMREVMAQADNPVMLYSVGKDSSVMLHLARKAFYPSPPPFPLMHVDTRWKFQAMYDFRDQMAREVGMELIVHINPEGVEKNINPFDHGSAVHTDIMKTQGLKQALDAHQFDVAFGGARRDEEKSRAKERVFSFRNEAHRWDPKNQRPELWNLYNGYKRKGESIRVFPLSNWTELDIWQYIYREHIPIVPLYFAAERPVVDRDGMLMMVDDDRMQLLPGEVISTRRIRFRTLGCYPLTGALESDADSLSTIVLELLQSRTSERQGRAIDSDSAGSMEKKKQEGYF